MSCAGSKRVESSKGFDCRNMGDVLGKECEKEDSSLSRAVEDVLRAEAEGAVSSGTGSESDSEKDLDSDEDLSWLLPINTMELGAKNCKCEGCLKLFESYSSDKKNAKLLLSSWKEFRNYLRNVYINSPLEAIQKNENISFEDNERLHEIVQVMRLCDPYQLFQKIEDEVCSMVLESRIRQLNMLKDENNPALAEAFIAGLIEEYVKLLSSALQLSPAIENLLGPQLQRFGLTWEVLNKQLYRSLVYNHFDVQQNLIRFIDQLRKMLPLKDDIYHELVHQYLALDGEMTLIGTMWKNVEPLIQEYRNLKSKENEKLNNLLDAMKDFFSNKLCSTEEEEEEEEKSSKEKKNKIENSGSEDVMESCFNCMTRRGCPCDECTVSHMMSCEDILLGMESPSEGNTPLRSRSPSQNISEVNEKKEIEEETFCECHVCTMPPPDLMDCSVTFNESMGKKVTHGEGFQLYPHIHGKVSEAEDVSNIYANRQMVNESVYPHLYNLHNHTNDENISQINGSLRDQLVEAIVANKLNSQSSYKSPGSPPPPPPPPPPSQESTPLTKNPPRPFLPPNDDNCKNSLNFSQEKPQEIKNIKKASVEEKKVNEPVKVVNKSESSKDLSPKGETKKNEKTETDKKESGSKGTKEKILPVETKETKDSKNSKETKVSQEKGQTKSQGGGGKGSGCVISGLCGKCCLKHGSNCLKMSGCNKGTDKHLAAIARLGLSGNSGSRPPLRCSGGKDDHTHRTIKSHSCNKTKHQDNGKKLPNKRNFEMDECLSPEDSCSEGSNSTSASTAKDPRHCDCCYCEVFGHGVPSVAPVNRNYQEMRERLRLRLSMKKSANCKTLQQGQIQSQTIGQKVSKTQINSSATKKDVKINVGEQDLETVLKYIEGKTSECKDAKKAAKRARQKQKKQEEKERQEEEEEERKRLEAVKRQVTISLVNDNKRSQNTKQNCQPSRITSTQNQKINQPQTLNLSGLKSLVEKSDPNAVPKMVTIRRVMAPFSNEPTVTITLKGSTPDKDKVLFMLKNGTEAVPIEEEPYNKKSKKSKKKGKQKEEIFEEEEEEEEEYEPPVETVPTKKKKKKNKQTETTATAASIPEPIANKTTLNNSNKSKKSKNSKNENNGNESNSKIVSQPSSKNSVAKPKTQNAKTQTPITKSSSSSLLLLSSSSSKTGSNKNTSVLKNRNQDSSTNNKQNKQNNNNNNNNNKSNNNNNNNNSNKKSTQTTNSVNNIRESGKGAVVSSGNSGSGSGSNKKCKNVKNENNLSNSGKEVKQSKKQKNESAQTISSVVQSKTKTTNSNNNNNNSNNNNKNNNKTVQKNGNKNNSFSESSLEEKVKEKSNETCKNKKKNGGGVGVGGGVGGAGGGSGIGSIPRTIAIGNDVELSSYKMSGRERPDNGKVIINTPSYRLSEVLSSIAPSPPPREEINLENLRLPPGITITKIEGPIQKPVKPTIQPSHVTKPAPPIIMATPTLKSTPPPGNVIVVDTGRLNEVVKENCQMSGMSGSESASSGKKKKKKNKKQNENISAPMEGPMVQSRFGTKVPKNCPQLNKRSLTVLSSMDARKMVPNLENQQATIIKTSDNMVTIRSPALQQAMNHAYQNGQSYRPGINGYSAPMNLFNQEVTRINDKMGKLKLGSDSDDRLTRQMRNLTMKDGNRENEILTQAIMAQTNQGNSKKKKKKKKQGKSGVEREVEPVESVFQPKDIDLENGDIDDDERELEAFKRFCQESIPPERKDKVKVNLNIKDIVLKKKSSAIGCS